MLRIVLRKFCATGHARNRPPSALELSSKECTNLVLPCSAPSRKILETLGKASPSHLARKSANPRGTSLVVDTQREPFRDR